MEPTQMNDRIFAPDILLVKLKRSTCNIESTQNSRKVSDTFFRIDQVEKEIELL